MLARLAEFCSRRRWFVLALWIVALAGAVVAAGSIETDYQNGGRLDGTDSQEAYDLLARSFPGGSSGDSATVVFSVPDGAIADHGTAIGTYLTGLEELPFVNGVTGPFDGPGQISADGTIAFATVDVPTYEDLVDAGYDETDLVDGLRADLGSLSDDGVTADFGGWWFTEGGMPAAEAFGLVAAAFILLLAFGSILAAGLPLVTAIIGVGIGVSGVALWSTAVSTPDFTIQVASMMAIGVGIDYALFIVTRFRELRRDGFDPHRATVAAVATAGRAVLFAGLTVMVSLLGMLLIGVDMLTGLALGSASAIAVAVVAAVTLLPALMSLFGGRIRPLADPPTDGNGTHTGLWFRWSRQLQRHPVPAAVFGLAVLLAATAPTLALRLGFADAGSDPEGTTTREAYDLLAEGFGPGFNGPLVLVAEDAGRGGAPAALEALATELATVDGVAFVTPPTPGPAGDAALLTVFPTSGPEEDATVELVERLRADYGDLDGVEVHIGGITASNIDFSELMTDRLPWFIGAVLICSFLLLLVSFRSVLVPVKAVIMNLLSIGAAYGVMVAVFQWGWGGGLLGVGGAPIESWAPMMLFAIVFGLSMDYEVFLLSRIRERYDATGDNGLAVADGLASTARVISAAAAIMVFVFGFFVFSDLRAIQLIGLGLATAVLIDATVVRLVLVPATMELLGDRNWWLPGWLDRILPRWDVEGHLDPVARPAVDADPVTAPVAVGMPD